MTMPAPSVYVVDDDASVRDGIQGVVRSAGWRVETFASAQEFLESTSPDVPGCLIVDSQLLGRSGLDLQQRLAKSSAQTSIIFLSGRGDIPPSGRAIKADTQFLIKPCDVGDLIEAIRRGVARAERERGEADERAKRLDALVQSAAAGQPPIGQSAIWKDVLRKAVQVASTQTTVLLQGESGTGKEVMARFIHRASPRKEGPFIAINCAALPEQLLESELFGHERGAFTGAHQSKPGQLELASGGTVFLDEVSEMSRSAQAKFLRVLQEREFQRLGGTRVMKAQVRVIAATNRDLLQAIERGLFREDLYYRLQVFEIRLPPLRDRRNDILVLAAAFLQDISRSFAHPPAGLSTDAKDALLAHGWPGNVRELRNALERAAIVCDGGLIVSHHLALPTQRRVPVSTTTDLKTVERQTIEQVMRETRGNKSQSARRLGLTRTQLYVRLRKYGLETLAPA